MKTFITIIFLLVLSTSISAQTKYQKDFNEFWTEIKENYAYFVKQDIDWGKVKQIYQSEADRVGDKKSLVSLFEKMVNELHNGHISLNINLPT